MEKVEVKETDETLWQVRVKVTLDRMVEKVVETDTHNTKSEFIRGAVRENWKEWVFHSRSRMKKSRFIYPYMDMFLITIGVVQ